MKTQLISILVILLVWTLSGCGGNASEVQLITGESNLYTEAEIEKAMFVAMDHFRKEFAGCTMTRIEYDESKTQAAAAEWAQNYGAREAIVLYSDFDVDATGGDGSLTPNSTYRNWQWILTRDEGKGWVLRTWGYG